MNERERKNAARRAAVLALPAVQAWHHSRIVPPRQGDVRISESIGPFGELMAVWSAPADRTARFSEVRPVRVTVHVPEMAVAARIADLRLAHPSVQPLPEGRVLLVDARCAWRSEGPDRNAVVYDCDGEAVAEQTFGDGIDHVQATRNGEIWVGYFDEGVLGSHGWGVDGAAPPVGRSGLVRFSADLTEQWRYPDSARLVWGRILDCYALNVDGETAWACFYTEWPIVRIHDGSVTGWHNEIRGAAALTVRGSRLALYGGYEPVRDRLVAGVLGDNEFRVTGEYRLVLPDGGEVPREARVFGRGADLHIVTRHDWYRLSLEDLPA
ncbi:hypothetical protein L3Q65_43530 [Amycolatopsis sp. FU40]|uniref:hypothetical protein n=1 Tax=Amycolatopsis sp. FU40 TaxID=2914159 RepID=UPI001F1E8E05|nr:hypothetical protein [Amycolatopsis sp. FU40]UKD54662.1 hypothetical protein L3Q65_43530 [Amycolatopsis sp. FU40]